MPSDHELRLLLKASYGRDTVAAEQELSSTQPLHLDNYLQRVLRLFSKSFHAEGRLAAQHRASQGAIFQVPSFLMPLCAGSRVIQLSGDEDPIGFETIGGQCYYRCFLHPADSQHFAVLMAQGIPDPKRWFASPTSSHRSLFLMDPKNPALRPTILKVSLRATVYGFPRIIGPKEVARSVLMTRFVAEAFRSTSGKLPSGGRWTYFPETFALLPPAMDEGGYILRRYPEGTNARQDLFLPYYALLSHRTEGRWIDLLFQASGESDKETFLWSQLVLPVLELYQQLCFEFGLSPELHRQNVGLVIDGKSRRIKSLYLRDMDGVELDRPYRTHLGLAEGDGLPGWIAEWNDVIRTTAAQINQAFNFYFLGAMNLDQTTKGFLPRKRVYPFLRKVNETHLTAINRRFHQKLGGLGDIAPFWDELHGQIADPETIALVSNARRRSTAWYGRLRQMELWVGEQWNRLF